jgi:hypothetical protein
LKGISDSALENLIGIEAEVSFVKWSKELPLFADIDAYCRSKGFVLNYFTPGAAFHYDLPDHRLTAQGSVLMGDVLYFRSPESIAGGVKDGRWDASFLARTLALYLVYGNHEFAFVLLRQAVKKGLLNERDALHVEAMKLIKQRSGYGGRMSYRVIRHLRKVLRLPAGLDF